MAILTDTTECQETSQPVVQMLRNLDRNSDGMVDQQEALRVVWVGPMGDEGGEAFLSGQGKTDTPRPACRFPGGFRCQELETFSATHGLDRVSPQDPERV